MRRNAVRITKARRRFNRRAAWAAIIAGYCLISVISDQLLARTCTVHVYERAATKRFIQVGIIVPTTCLSSAKEMYRYSSSTVLE